MNGDMMDSSTLIPRQLLSELKFAFEMFRSYHDTLDAGAVQLGQCHVYVMQPRASGLPEAW